jgi:hypothetical protein
MLLMLTSSVFAQPADSPIDPTWTTGERSAKCDKLNSILTLKPVKNIVKNNSQQPVKEEVVIINSNTSTSTIMSKDEYNRLFNDPSSIRDFMNGASIPHQYGSAEVPSIPKSTNYSRSITITSTTKGSTTSSNIRLW